MRMMVVMVFIVSVLLFGDGCAAMPAETGVVGEPTSAGSRAFAPDPGGLLVGAVLGVEFVFDFDGELVDASVVLALGVAGPGGVVAFSFAVCAWG